MEQQLKNKLIKLLGGYTEKEVSAIKSEEYNRGRFHRSKNKSVHELRRLIHKELDIIFPGKKNNRSRYRFLKYYGLTTSHMSEMNHAELKKIHKLLRKIIKDSEGEV